MTCSFLLRWSNSTAQVYLNLDWLLNGLLKVMWKWNSINEYGLSLRAFSIKWTNSLWLSLLCIFLNVISNFNFASDNRVLLRSSMERILRIWMFERSVDIRENSCVAFCTMSVQFWSQNFDFSNGKVFRCWCLQLLTFSLIWFGLQLFFSFASFGCSVKLHCPRLKKGEEWCLLSESIKTFGEKLCSFDFLTFHCTFLLFSQAPNTLSLHLALFSANLFVLTLVWLAFPPVHGDW